MVPRKEIPGMLCDERHHWGGKYLGFTELCFLACCRNSSWFGERRTLQFMLSPFLHRHLRVFAQLAVLRERNQRSDDGLAILKRRKQAKWEGRSAETSSTDALAAFGALPILQGSKSDIRRRASSTGSRRNTFGAIQWGAGWGGSEGSVHLTCTRIRPRRKMERGSVQNTDTTGSITGDKGDNHKTTWPSTRPQAPVAVSQAGETWNRPGCPEYASVCVLLCLFSFVVAHLGVLLHLPAGVPPGHDGASAVLSAGREVTFSMGAFHVSSSSVKHCDWPSDVEQLRGLVMVVVVVPLKRILGGGRVSTP